MKIDPVMAIFQVGVISPNFISAVVVSGFVRQ